MDPVVKNECPNCKLNPLTSPKNIETQLEFNDGKYYFTEWCGLECSHTFCFDCCIKFLFRLKTRGQKGCSIQGCGHLFKKDASLGADGPRIVSRVRKKLTNIRLPTTTVCNQDLVTDLIKGHTNEETKSQQKKETLSKQRSEKDENIKNLKKKIQNAKDNFEVKRNKLEKRLKLLVDENKLAQDILEDKICKEMKERDEIDAKIISCQSEVRKRKRLREALKAYKEIEADTIDVNDNSVLEDLRQNRENDPKRIKREISISKQSKTIQTPQCSANSEVGFENCGPRRPPSTIDWPCGSYFEPDYDDDLDI